MTGNENIQSYIVGCGGDVQLGGLVLAGYQQVPLKVKARKSILFTEGSSEIKTNDL